MFSKAALLIASTFALSAIAGGHSNVVNSCNTGTVYCCNQVQDVSQFDDTTLLSFASFVPNFSSMTGQFGVACVAGAYKGAAGNSCTQQTACCTGNQYNGGFVAGCSPFNFNA